MLLYLSGHSRPDIHFAVSQCARWSHDPKRSHEKALERIGLYLKGTREKGLILQPEATENLSIDMYCDANFAGMWGYEDPQDEACAKSRTGYVIYIANCPVLWVSCLQDTIATSTMEAEYNALSMGMRDLLPIQHLAVELSKRLGIEKLDTTKICKTVVHEDNQGCLNLSQLDPGRMTPRSKFYAVKYHWFRSHLKPESIIIKYVVSALQRADFLTKGLREPLFSNNQRLTTGW